MFCGQCGRQIPDGSRYCNYCGTAIAVDDMNPDERMEEERYQDYGGFDTPKGFETLPYNKHGYGRQVANSQQTKVPKGGFVQKDYTQQGHRQPNGSPQKDCILQGSFSQGAASGSTAQSPYGQQNAFSQSDVPGGMIPGPYTQNNGQGQYGGGFYPGSSVGRQTANGQPWQDPASRPAARKKKWLLPVIIGAAALLLILAVILLFSCSSEKEGSASADDPMLQANLCNWGYACKKGEDYYVVSPHSGLVKMKEISLKDADDAPEPEMVIALPAEIDGVEYTMIDDLVPVGKWLYFQMIGSVPDSEKTVFRYCALDTESGRYHELFSVSGSSCFTIDKKGDRIYFCLDGDLCYIDTQISPDKGAACKFETNIRLGDDPNVAACPEGFLVAQQGNCRGLKLISPDNKTLRVYDKVQDQELYIYLVWNGYAYYRRDDTDDRMTIYRIDLKTGEYEVFATQESMGDPTSMRMSAYEDRILVGVARETDSGTYRYGIMQFFENGELRLEATIPDAQDMGFSLLCMVNAGRYMITRLVLLPDSPTMHVYQLPDMQKLQ